MSKGKADAELAASVARQATHPVSIDNFERKKKVKRLIHFEVFLLEHWPVY
jgi:hypothetical protein